MKPLVRSDRGFKTTTGDGEIPSRLTICYNRGMAVPLAKHYLTPEEYYLQERVAEVRHDYYGGEIFDISGGTIVHSRICSNIIGELSRQLKGSPCAAFEANLRLRIMATGL